MWFGNPWRRRLARAPAVHAGKCGHAGGHVSGRGHGNHDGLPAGADHGPPKKLGAAAVAVMFGGGDAANDASRLGLPLELVQTAETHADVEVFPTIATRCCCPPESCDGFALMNLIMPT